MWFLFLQTFVPEVEEFERNHVGRDGESVVAKGV